MARCSVMGALLALASLVWVASCGSDRPPVAPAQTLVWVVIDTLRADALGSYGNTAVGEGGQLPSPNLDALGEQAWTFERAYSTAPWTVPSVVSQLTGRWPFEHGVSRLLEPLSEGLSTLPQVLSRQGFRTAGVSTNFVVTAPLGFDRGFDRFSDEYALGHKGSYGSAAVARLLEFSDQLATEDPALRRFLWALLFEPHFRYEAHLGMRFGAGFGSLADQPAYAGPLNGNEPLAELRSALAAARFQPADLEFLRGLYQSDVAAADRAFGELRAGLEARGLWDQAWVVVTADHGEELGEQGWLGHSIHLSEALVRVPLWIKPPRELVGQVRRIETPVSQVDLMDTCLDAAGLPPEARPRVTSRSLLPLLLGERLEPRRFLFLHTDFEPVLGEELASTKRAQVWGVVDGERGIKWVVDRSPQAGSEGQPRATGRLFRLEPAGAEQQLPVDSEPLRDLWRLRGLCPEPLGDRPGAEPMLPPEFAGG